MRTCENCGANIVLKNAHARTCSPRCRVALHRRGKTSPIPSRMRESARWIRHDSLKRPLTVTGHSASSTNANTWSTYSEAVSSAAGVGLGFVLGEGIGCLDLDHCLESGVPSEQAQKVLDTYPRNYVEVSPSGDGLHIWGLLPEGKGSRRIIDGLNIETYSVGRYITVTGRVFRPGVLAPLS